MKQKDMQTKKILFLITKSNWGGAQRYVFDLVTNLPKNYEAVVAFGENGELSERLRKVGIKTHFIESLSRDVNIKNDFKVFFELWGLLRREKPDVLHVNSSKAGGLGVLAGRLALVSKVIFTAHGWAFMDERPFWQRVIIKFLHWITVVFSHATIAVSGGTKREASHWPFMEKKITVVYNGIREPKFLDRQKARIALEKIHPGLKQVFWSQENFIIGTIAELHRCKNLSLVIEVLASIKQKHANIFFLIIGGGEEKEALKNLAKKRGVENQVLFLGQVPDASRYLKTLDVFALPSKKEGFPYVLLEAAWANLPVLATNTGGISDIILDEKTGLLVPSENHSRFREELLRYKENPNERKMLADNLKNRVSEHITFEKMLEETFKIYES